MKVTRIEWLDAQTVTSGGWQEIDSLVDFGLATVETAGFVYYENDDYVVVINSHSDGDSCIGGISIPKVLIQSRKDVTLIEDK